MGILTTHVLDTANGRPGAGMAIDLYRIADGREHLGRTATNSNGRCDQPLLQGDGFTPGEYELVFHAGDYFAALGLDLPRPRFLDRIVIRFGLSDDREHYHVPLLVSPFGYSTYRGS